MDNFIIRRRTNIAKQLVIFLSMDVSKLISEYDYYLEGTTHTFKFESFPYFGFLDNIAILSDQRILYDSKILNLQTGIHDVIFNDVMRCVAVLPDGRIISESNTGRIKLWNQYIGECEFVLTGTSKPLNHITVLPSGRIVSVTHDNKIKIWKLHSKEIDFENKNTDKSKILHEVFEEPVCDITFTGHTNRVTCVVILPDERIVTGSLDTTLKVWNPNTRMLDHTLTGHSKGITCVSVLSDGRIVSGSYDGTLKIWNLQTGTSSRRARSSGQLQSSNPEGNCDLTFMHHSYDNDEIYCVVTLSDYSLGCSAEKAERIISGSRMGKISVWNIQTGKCDITFTGHYKSINHIAVLPDRRIVSGSDDNTIKIWNITKEISQRKDCNAIFSEHTDWISYLSVLQDGRIVSGSYDRTLKIWS
jgi:WD40 repeat protein